MATGIDFMAIARGREAAYSDNYKDIQRIQQQEQYGFSREQQLAKQLQERQNREATHYLSTVMPNLQRYADQGMDPVEALLNQRAMILDHADFKSMAPEVQSAVLNGLGETAKFQAEALAKAGKWEDLNKLTAAFGSPSPLNPLGVAAASGDPLAVFKAVSERSPGAYTLSPDQKFVIDRAGNRVPLNDWAAYTVAGLGEANSAAGGLGAFQQAGQEARTQAAIEAQKVQEDTYNAMLLIKSGKVTEEEAKQIFQKANLPAAAGSTTPWGATVASPEQAAALRTPTLPGESATPVIGAGGTEPVAASRPVPAESWQQIVAQVQTANKPQLDSSLKTVATQIKEGQARLSELTQMQQQYQAELNKVLPSTTAAGYAERGLSASTALDAGQESYIRALQAELAKVEQEARAIAQNMRGFDRLAREIQTRKRVLGLPVLNKASGTDWLTQLQGELSQ